jgi:hypothetical protein
MTTLTTLRRLSNQFFKAFQALDHDSKSNPDLYPRLLQVKELWLDTYNEVERLEAAEAERKDKGVVLWEIFHPRYGSRGTRVVRTPNRVIRHDWFQEKPRVEVLVTPRDPWAEFAREMNFVS